MKLKNLKQRPAKLAARRRESQVNLPEVDYFFAPNPEGNEGSDWCPLCPGKMIQVGKSYLALKCGGRKPSRDYPQGVEPCGYLRKTL